MARATPIPTRPGMGRRSANVSSDKMAAAAVLRRSHRPGPGLGT